VVEGRWQVAQWGGDPQAKSRCLHLSHFLAAVALTYAAAAAAAAAMLLLPMPLLLL